MKLRPFEIVLFAIFGTMMYVSKLLMEFLPNIHLIATLITVFTVIYRSKALISIYVFAFINFFMSGFSPWSIPYFYVWTILWGAIMLLPRSMPERIAIPVYMIVCAMHGFLFGILYSPAQALLFGLSFEGTVAWVISGLRYDLVHGISNFLSATLVIPLVTALKKATHHY